MDKDINAYIPGNEKPDQPLNDPNIDTENTTPEATTNVFTKPHTKKLRLPSNSIGFDAEPDNPLST